MRTAIVGVGDYGSRLAAQLITSGEDVTLIARGRTLERLKTEGLKASPGPSDPGLHVQKVNATNDSAAVGPVDVVLLCVKLYQLDDAMEAASPLVGESTAVLGFQNGVTAENRLINRFGALHVLGAASGAGPVPLAIGELPGGTSARTSSIVQMFKDANTNAVEHENVLEAIWGKFLITCGGSIAALSRLSIGQLAEFPDLRKLGGMAISEAIELANAKGLKFGDEQLEKFDNVLTEVSESNPGWRPSLLQDLDAGRPLELDAWCGGAVKIGQELGKATPVNFAMYAALKPYENGNM